MMGRRRRSLLEQSIQVLLIVGLLCSLPMTRSFTSSNCRFSHRFSTFIATTRDSSPYPAQISIVGGGLAGLSTAYHFLTKIDDRNASVTIYDKCPVGEGGASAVAGGLLHPLSPRGNKLSHWGLEGLFATRKLVDEAAKFAPHCVLREKLYRVALTDENVQALQHVATNVLPEHCRWMEKKELDKLLDTSDSLGGVELYNGCRVIHVPSYLRGLLAACQLRGRVEWKIIDDYMELVNHRHDENVQNDGSRIWIFACGAGIIQEGFFDEDARAKLPLQIVRGQSVELTITDESVPREAALCGKYVTPLLDHNRMLVGATQEFQEEAVSPRDLQEELKRKSYKLAPALWDKADIHRITCGYKVQSQRNNLGRVPIIGRLGKDWIFTGLSSRGLLYHAIYGEKLVDMIFASQGTQKDSEECPIAKQYPHLKWWK
mmetsp:Transcript_11020/g.16879  ORF Transcript_11020/g.16879 Transcript_11020/m.16879 type:complete len:431 (+) Transcript_11020:174-1466(+)